MNNPDNRITSWRYKPSRAERVKFELKRIFETTAVETVEQLTKALQLACHRALENPAGRIKKGVPWWSARLTLLRSEVVRTRRKAMRSRRKMNGECDPAILEEHRAAYKVLKEEITNAKRRKLERSIEELNSNPWGPAFRRAIRTTPGAVKLTPEQEEEIIKNLFPSHPAFPREVAYDGGLEPFSMEELQLAAVKLRRGKANGPDGIPSEVVRLAVEGHGENLLMIFNGLLASGNFPAAWKVGTLRLIPKGGAVGERSFRPICLLDSLGKLLEHLIAQRLRDELKRTNGISPNQHGFCPGKSTMTAIQSVLRFCDKTLQATQRLTPGIILFDVKNAFNSAPWIRILSRLRELEIKPYLRTMINSYLGNRKLISSQGLEVELSSGVPQGSVLGPLLWIVLYNNLLEQNLCEDSTTIGYADDLAVLISGGSDNQLKHRGNLAISRVAKWMCDNELELAVHKTEVLFFCGQRRSCVDVKLALGTTEIKPSRNVKYLGIWLDERLNFQTHADKAVEGARRIGRLLNAVMTADSVMQSKRRTIGTVIEAKLLYGAEVWNKRMTGMAMKRLEGVQREMALMIIKGYSTISTEAAFVLSGLMPISIQAAARASRFDTGTKVSRVDMMKEWQRRWERSQTGSWTRRLIPEIQAWRNRKFGEADFITTQILSGHGCFALYLKRMNRAASGRCQMCEGGLEESTDHKVFRCPGWREARGRCEATTGELTPESIVSVMTGSFRGWAAVREMAGKMLITD